MSVNHAKSPKAFLDRPSDTPASGTPDFGIPVWHPSVAISARLSNENAAILVWPCCHTSGDKMPADMGIVDRLLVTVPPSAAMFHWRSRLSLPLSLYERRTNGLHALPIGRNTAPGAQGTGYRLPGFRLAVVRRCTSQSGSPNHSIKDAFREAIVYAACTRCH